MVKRWEKREIKYIPFLRAPDATVSKLDVFPGTKMANSIWEKITTNKYSRKYGRKNKLVLTCGIFDFM